MNVARSVGIWVSGCIVAGAIGTTIGYRVSGYGGDFFGMIAGICAFVCVRLWYSEARDREPIE